MYVVLLILFNRLMYSQIFFAYVETLDEHTNVISIIVKCTVHFNVLLLLAKVYSQIC